MTSRPARVWIPTPGPVAYQVQSGRLTSRVISTGFDQEAPSSVLLLTQTERGPLLVPATICASLSWPRLCVISSQIAPVARSTTAHGLPQVLGPSSQTTCKGCHDLPPSRLRFRTRSISPVSLELFLRPSQNARRVPLADTSSEGMR